MGVLEELNDNCFVITTEFLTDLSKQVEEEVGRKPTLKELCELLLWGLHGSAEEILSDVDAACVASFVAKCSKKKTRVSRGDLVAVPDGAGSWYLGVYIASNRFGCAYGFFRGSWSLRPFPATETPVPLFPVVYADKGGIQQGEWKVIGNRPDLLKHFPEVPEIFHYKEDNEDNPAIGPFGSAETADGELRKVSEEEARLVGLLDRTYIHTVCADEVRDYLKVHNERRRSSRD